MIEVERKFLLSEEEQERLTRDAEFISERAFTDIYYDTDTFALTTTDRWLRSREGKFELKLPLLQGTERIADQYTELEEEQKIRRVLNLPAETNFSQTLEQAGYTPFCICTSIRRKYKKDSFIIDLDKVNFQNFMYFIGEIELMVNQESEIKAAVEKIRTFAEENRLTIAPVRGKVIEFLKRERPEQYRALIQAAVVKDY
jgi:predicted adenylyl cyclase CyaB